MKKDKHPEKADPGKGFHYTVNDEQVAAHRKRTVKEIFALAGENQQVYLCRTNA